MYNNYVITIKSIQGIIYYLIFSVWFNSTFPEFAEVKFLRNLKICGKLSGNIEREIERGKERVRDRKKERKREKERERERKREKERERER